MLDHHIIIFYISIAVTVVAFILAIIIMMRYMFKQLQLCKEVQDKLLKTFKLMEQAHEITLEALKSTEAFLKHTAETCTDQQEITDRMYAKLSRLEEETIDLTERVRCIESEMSFTDDCR